MRRLLASIALASLAISGCAPNSLRYASVKDSPPPASNRETTAVIVTDDGSCRSHYFSDKANEGGGAGVTPADAVIGFGVDLAANLVSAGLKYLKDGRNAVWSAASSIGDLPSIKNGCVRVLRGVVTNTSGARIVFSDAAIFDSYFDIAVKPLDGDKTKISVSATPFQLAYGDTSAPVRGKGRKTVSILLAFSGQTLAAGAQAAPEPSTEGALGVLRLDLGRLETRRTYERKLLGTISASTAFAQAKPTMITAIVFETEGPDPLLEATISAFDSNKGDLSTALKNALGGKKGN